MCYVWVPGFWSVQTLWNVELKSDNKINYQEQGKKMFLISDDISLLSRYYCQAQSQLQLQPQLGTELALVLLAPATHPHTPTPTHPWKFIFESFSTKLTCMQPLPIHNLTPALAGDCNSYSLTRSGYPPPSSPVHIQYISISSNGLLFEFESSMTSSRQKLNFI